MDGLGLSLVYHGLVRVFVASCLLLAACEGAAPATQVFVTVNAEDGVRRETRSLRIRVFPKASRAAAAAVQPSYERTFAVTPDGRGWPRRIALAPKNGDVSRWYAVVAQAIEGLAVVVEGSRMTRDDDLSRMSKSVVESVDGTDLSLGSGEFGFGIAAAPGISRTDEISGQFVVRGGLPEQNVFKLDGAPVYQPWHSQGLFSILQPST